MSVCLTEVAPQSSCALPAKGYWFPPTFLTGVTHAKICFLPTTLTRSAPTLSRSRRRGAGVVWANTYNKFDPTSPFGGYKESGFGREGGLQGLAADCKLDRVRIQFRHADLFAMLRGINVSGQKLIKMERLRASLEALGAGDVQTYIQSGNVVFKAAKQSSDSLAKKIAGNILDGFGFPVPVLLRTAAEMAAVVRGNPFVQEAGVDHSKLHVTFLSDTAPPAAEKPLAALAAKSERFRVRGREIYLCFPDGYGSTKLSNSAIEKKLSLQATTRNWKTVNVLSEMAT